MRFTLVPSRSSSRALLGLAGSAAILTGGFGLSVVHADSAAAQAKLTANLQGSALTVKGTNADDTIVLRLRAGDPATLEVLSSLAGPADFQFKLASIQSIAVSGGAGNDVITVDESNGPITIGATLDGGTGNDTLTGGSGQDTFPWNPGDGSDVINGGGGGDTVRVKGEDSAETYSLVPNGLGRVVLARIDQVPFTLDIGGVANLSLDMKGGNDTFTGSNGVSTLINLTVDGGSGDDRILGGDGADTLIGGFGNDFIDGNRGNDVVFGGAGNDTFQWDPGDGSDTLEGQGGSDTMLFNGSNIGEKIDLSANGNRLRFTRDVAAITMDVAGVETVHVNTLGGADEVNVHDLSSTDVNNVEVNLAAFDGNGDGAADNVIVNGTEGNDRIVATADATSTSVKGVGSKVTVTGSEVDSDRLTADGLGGDDLFDGSALGGSTIQFSPDGGEGIDTVKVEGGDGPETFGAAPNGTSMAFFRTTPSPFRMNITAENLNLDMNGGDDTFEGSNGLSTFALLNIDGGAGNDRILGGDGADILTGGPGDDFVDGNRGNDIVSLGAGNDTFQWDPGDGSDTVEGGDGTDTMLFNGSNIGEKIDLSANGNRLLFTRDVASIVMDLHGVEAVTFRALGGADQVTVNNLAGTGVKNVNIDLTASLGGGDGAADQVIVNGRPGADVITIAGSAASGVNITGLPATVGIIGAEVANDRLTVNGGDGDDIINATGLTADAIQFTGNGGNGNDVVDGGAGDDILIGGPGDDVLVGGPGQDVLDGAPGADVLIQ